MIKQRFSLFFWIIGAVVFTSFWSSSSTAADNPLPDVRIIAQGSMQGLTFPAG